MSATQINGNKQIQPATIQDSNVAPIGTPSGYLGITTAKLADGALFVKSDGTVVMGAALNLGSHNIINLLDPVNPQDAATRNWVLGQIGSGVVASSTAKVATTANIALTGIQTIDGVAGTAGDVVLVMNQTTASANGLYVAAAGAWARHSSMSTWAQVPGMIVSVQEGTLQHDTIWLSTADPGGTLGTTAITFVQIPGPSDIQAGAGLQRTGQRLDVVPADNTLAVTTGPGTIKVNPAVMLLKQDFVSRETPSGLVNGTNTVFNLAFTPVNNGPGGTSGEMVFLNGLLQEPGAGNDYTISGFAITFLTAPLTGDRIRVSYMKGAAITGP